MNKKMNKKAIVLALLLAVSVGGYSQITVGYTADTVCLGTATQLTSTSTTSIGLIIEENWDLNNNGQFNNASGSSISFQFSNADTLNVGLQVINNQGDTSFSYQMIVVLYQPSSSFIPSEVCIGNNTNFFNQSSSYQGDSLSYVWGFGDTFSSTAMAPQHQYSDSGAYSASLTVTSMSGCSDVSSQTVSVNGLPTISISATDTMICLEVGFVTLTATTNASIFFWQSGENLANITVFDTGWYYVVATDVNTCINRDSVKITPYAIPVMTVSSDTFVVVGNSVSLMASGMSTYSWAPSESLDNETSDEPLSSPTETTIYLVTGTSVDGCTATGQVTVEVKEDYSIEFSSILTPNGDGINDQFVIGNIGSFAGCGFNIFNKWGDDVFSSDSYQNDWDGTFSGNPLPEGTYYFTMECPIESNSFTGAISILR